MTVRTKLLILGGAGIIPAIAIAAISWRAIAAFDTHTREFLTLGKALGNHWEGDMMHEGLRADVYASLAAESPEAQAKVRSDVREDAERFRQAVARNRKLVLDPAVASALDALVPRLEAYIAEAVGIVDQAGTDRAGALRRMPRFQQTFEALDDAQARVSDLIGNRSESAAKDAERLASRGTQWMGGISLLMLFGLIGGAWLLARSIAGRLASGLASIADGSRQVAAAAAGIANSSESLAQAASEQAASLEQTSASAGQIRATTQRNAGSSAAATSATQETIEEMARASEAVHEMAVSMNEIVESASKIEKIIKVIDGIAFQTNMLALNAAVEAARAGEAGLGFAVVADEVRSLAHRSAEAASNTTELIQEAIERSHRGKTRLDSLSVLIASVEEKASRIGTLSEQVAANSSEQTRGIDQIARGVSGLQEVTQRIAANAEEHRAAAEELTAQAAGLDGIIDSLSEAVGAKATAGAAAVEDTVGMFAWSSRFATGVASVDAQHQKLFELAQRLHGAMKEGAARSVLQQLLDGLIEYTEYHFRAEEELMRGHGYAGLEEHKRLHAALTRQVRQFAAEFRAGRADVSVDLMRFLRDWLYRHILECDRQYVPALQGRGELVRSSR